MLEGVKCTQSTLKPYVVPIVLVGEKGVELEKLERLKSDALGATNVSEGL